MEIAQGSLPGHGAIRETGEWSGLYRGDNGEMLTLRSQVIIGSSAVDAGNSPTTTLRAGLLLGQKTSDGLFYPVDETATDGTQNPLLVLPIQLSMLNVLGVAENKMVACIQRGNMLKAQLGTQTEQALRALAQRGFNIDVPGGAMAFHGHRGHEVVTGNTSPTAADSGKLYILTTAAGNFTLPAIAAGLAFEFLNTADNNMVITGSANIIAFGNAAANTITYSTVSQKIGSRARVRATQFGATLKWTVENLGGTTMTIA